MDVCGDVEPYREPEDLALAELALERLGRIALENPEMLLQDLAEGPVSNSLPVRKTAPGSPKRVRRGAAQHFPEFPHEPGLADACLPDDRHEVRAPLLDHSAVRGVDLFKLGFPTDKRTA